MKRVLIFVPVVAAALGLTSCEKCTECTLTSAVLKDEADNNYYLWADGTVRSLPEGHKSSTSATAFAINCNDLEGCIDGVYHEYCGDERNKVQQEPYVVSGTTANGEVYTVEYTYDCR